MCSIRNKRKGERSKTGGMVYIVPAGVLFLLYLFSFVCSLCSARRKTLAGPRCQAVPINWLMLYPTPHKSIHNPHNGQSQSPISLHCWRAVFERRQETEKKREDKPKPSEKKEKVLVSYHGPALPSTSHHRGFRLSLSSIAVLP